MSAATFVIRVEPDGDALHRVLAICHRRAVTIVSLSYTGSEIGLTVEGDEQRCRHLKVWLEALRDVRHVKYPECSAGAGLRTVRGGQSGVEHGDQAVVAVVDVDRETEAALALE